MRVVSIEDQKAEAAFALRAAQDMGDHPRHYTYAEGDPEPGKFFAIRWNSFTVLVIKLDPEHVPACYPTHQLIAGDLPPMQPALY